MRGLEPNLLLALSTGLALLLLVLTAGTYGRPEFMIRYLTMAFGFSACYVALNTLIERRSPAPPLPMIPRDVVGIPWAMVIPVATLAAAAVPVILPGRDLALVIIVATVFFGLTVRSAMRARA